MIPLKGAGSVILTEGGGGGFPLTQEAWYVLADTDWPVASMPTAREGPVAVVHNGLIYVIGGFTAATTGSAKVERYNPATNSWSTMADMPAARGWGVAGVIGDNIYYAGGSANASTPQATVYEYDITGDSWSTLTLDPLPAVRILAGGGVYADTLRVIGGQDSTNVRSTHYIFDPQATAGSRWTTGTAMSSNRARISTVGGDALFCTGGTTSGAALSSGTRWTGSAWTGTPQLDEQGSTIAAHQRHVNAFLDGRYYHLTGTDNSGAIVTICMRTNAGNSAWESTGGVPNMTAIPSGRRYPACAVLGGIVYVFGGHDGSGYTATIQAYVPPEGATRPF